MERNRYVQVTAVAGHADRSDELGLGANLQSGYIQRASADLPRQGTRSPWRSLSHYYRDAFALRLRRLDDPVLEFATADTGD